MDIEIDDLPSLAKSTLWAVSVGGASQLASLLTGPIVIASFEIAASFGWVGLLLGVVVLLKFVVEDCREYVSMGYFAFVAIIVILLPLGLALALMLLSWAGLALMGERV